MVFRGLYFFLLYIFTVETRIRHIFYVTKAFSLHHTLENVFHVFLKSFLFVCLFVLHPTQPKHSVFTPYPVHFLFVCLFYTTLYQNIQYLRHTL